MMLQKSLTLVLCTAIVLALFQPANSATVPRNHLIKGRKGPNDKLLQQEIIKREWTIGGNIEATYSYTNPGTTRISYIEALDQSTNGHGAKPEIVKGGVGYNFVDMKFRSGVFRGIDFVVNIYAPGN